MYIGKSEACQLCVRFKRQNSKRNRGQMEIILVKFTLGDDAVCEALTRLQSRQNILGLFSNAGTQGTGSFEIHEGYKVRCHCIARLYI